LASRKKGKEKKEKKKTSSPGKEKREKKARRRVRENLLDGKGTHLLQSTKRGVKREDPSEGGKGGTRLFQRRREAPSLDDHEEEKGLTYTLDKEKKRSKKRKTEEE